MNDNIMAVAIFGVLGVLLLINGDDVGFKATGVIFIIIASMMIGVGMGQNKD